MRSSTKIPTALPSETSTPGRRLDLGRVIMVPVSILCGVAAIGKIVSLLNDGSPLGALGAIVTAGLTTIFYALFVYAYLRRGPARATSAVTLALIAAPVATFLPFSLPYVAAGGASTGIIAVGDLLLVLGMAWSLWSVRCLDRSLSLVPQARVLIEHGPYRLVRHPLYLGELVAVLGLALTLGGTAPLVVWIGLTLLQCYRAVQEESLLSEHLPGYADYRARTARVLPGLF